MGLAIEHGYDPRFTVSETVFLPVRRLDKCDAYWCRAKQFPTYEMGEAPSLPSVIFVAAHGDAPCPLPYEGSRQLYPTPRFLGDYRVMLSIGLLHRQVSHFLTLATILGTSHFYPKIYSLPQLHVVPKPIKL